MEDVLHPRDGPSYTIRPLRSLSSSGFTFQMLVMVVLPANAEKARIPGSHLRKLEIWRASRLLLTPPERRSPQLYRGTGALAPSSG